MKVYIASPFFNEEQLERVKTIEKLLTSHDVEYFSPRRDTCVKPDSSDKERKLAFSDNLEAIRSSHFIIAVTDGKDVGTMFEAGYAFAEHVPILYFAETLGDRPFNLMLAMSGYFRICKSREQLDKSIFNISNAASFDEYAMQAEKEKSFEGEIE